MVKILLVNCITAARFIAAIVLFFDIQGGPDYARETLIFFAMGLTDILDGFLARQLNATTKFGAAFDATTDKFVVAAVLPALWLYRSFPTWVGVYLVVMLALWVWQYYAYIKEMAIPPKPRKLGRACQTMAVFTVMLFLVGRPDIGNYVIVIPVIMNIGAFFDYKRAYSFRWWPFR